MAQIFHVATAADWAAAQRSGSYQTSTRGRTLAEEGFIHAAHREQVRGVVDRSYRGLDEPLVLLTIETNRLAVDVRDEAPDPDRPRQTFPHIYGPLPVSAVSDVTRLKKTGELPGMTELWVVDMLRFAALAVMAMLLSFLGAYVAQRLLGEDWRLVGALVGLGVGVGVALLVRRRF